MAQLSPSLFLSIPVSVLFTVSNLSIVFSTISFSFFNSKFKVSLVSLYPQVSVIHSLKSRYSILYYFFLSLQCLLSAHSISSISLFSILSALCYSQYQILLLGCFSSSQFQNSLGLRLSRFLCTTPVVIMSSRFFTPLSLEMSFSASYSDVVNVLRESISTSSAVTISLSFLLWLSSSSQTLVSLVFFKSLQWLHRSSWVVPPLTSSNQCTRYISLEWLR